MTPTGKERLLNWALGAITATGIVFLTSFINKRTYEKNKEEIVIENMADIPYVNEKFDNAISHSDAGDLKIEESFTNYKQGHKELHDSENELLKSIDENVKILLNKQ
jgi:hypothetical protein